MKAKIKLLRKQFYSTLNLRGDSMKPGSFRLQTPQALLFTFFLLALLPVSAPAQQGRVPQFKDYAVNEIYKGKSARPILDRDSRAFRTRLRSAAKEKPNFAGRYIVTAWGCGTSCLIGAVIDAKTGRVYWFPESLCCWGYDIDDDFRPIEYRLNSRLIIFSGARGEKEGDNGTHFYKFDNGRFVHLRSVMKPEQN
jgi:hypothetical protein